MKGFNINIPTSRKIIGMFMNYTFLFIVLLLSTIIIYWVLNTQKIRHITCNASYTMMDSVRLRYYFEVNNGLGQEVYLNNGKVYKYKPSDRLTVYMSGIPIYTQDNTYQIEQYKQTLRVPSSYLTGSMVSTDSVEVACLMNGSETILISGDWYFPPYPFANDTIFSSLYVSLTTPHAKNKHHVELDYSEDKLIASTKYVDFDAKFKQNVYLGTQGEYYTDMLSIDGTRNSSLMQIKPSSPKDIGFETTYSGDFFDSTSGIIHTIINFDIENMDNMEEITITFAMGLTQPYRIISLYPEPDETNANEIRYKSREKLSSMKFYGLSFNIEQVNKRDKVNKLCFVLATLIGVFTSILAEIALQKLAQKRKSVH